MLNDAEFLRYSRQIMLPMCGEAGIKSLQQRRVAIVGLGGLGSIAAPYLAGAGVGQLVLIDDDAMSTSNLPRQWLYAEQLGENKAFAAKRALNKINPMCQVEAKPRHFCSGNAENLLVGVDAVLDCTDNMATRQQINAACFALKLPLISAAAIATEAQCLAISPAYSKNNDAGCYHCLYPFEQPRDMTCTSAGVLGPIVGMAASLQASLALQLLLREESVRWSVFWRMDSATFQHQQFKVPKDPDCSICSA